MVLGHHTEGMKMGLLRDVAQAVSLRHPYFEGVVRGALEPHRGDEKSQLEDLCVLCASAVIFEGGVQKK
ncbi:MAG: hypothetical protein D6723_00975 [Acidobacteria bacterium]|nr:MAG: hypothetical protein D6723_00975 [Acidobacteriota bacterium]